MSDRYLPRLPAQGGCRRVVCQKGDKESCVVSRSIRKQKFYRQWVDTVVVLRLDLLVIWWKTMLGQRKTVKRSELYLVKFKLLCSKMSGFIYECRWNTGSGGKPTVPPPPTPTSSPMNRSDHHIRPKTTGLPMTFGTKMNNTVKRSGPRIPVLGSRRVTGDEWSVQGLDGRLPVPLMSTNKNDKEWGCNRLFGVFSVHYLGVTVYSGYSLYIILSRFQWEIL